MTGTQQTNKVHQPRLMYQACVRASAAGETGDHRDVAPSRISHPKPRIANAPRTFPAVAIVTNSQTG